MKTLERDAPFVYGTRPPEGAPPPPEGAERIRFFRFASTSLRGLPAAFWILQAYLFIATTFLDEEWPSIGALRPRLILGTLALAVAGWRFVTRPRTRVHVPREDRWVTGWLVAFMIAGLLSALWAFDTGVAWPAQIDHTTIMLSFFLVLAIVRTRRELAVTLLVFLAASGVYLLRSFTEYLNGKHLFTMGVSRMMGAGKSVGDPNSFAATIAFTLPLVTFGLRHTTSRLLSFCLACYWGLGAVCSMLTHSRSGLVLLLLNVVLATATTRSRNVRLGLVLFLAVAGAYAAAGMTAEEQARYLSILEPDTYKNESSTVGRIEGYKIAWRMFQDEPALGVGPGNWAVYRVRRIDGNDLMPHNMTGQLLATLGAAGAVTFLGYVVAVLSLALGVRRRLASVTDPWSRAVTGLAAVTVLSIVLLFVSGMGAHNVDRASWYLVPALLCVALRAKDDAPVEAPAEGAATAEPDGPLGGLSP